MTANITTSEKVSFAMWFTQRLTLMSFLLPFSVVILAFISSGFAPFGGVSLMAMDAYSQYFPMLKEMTRGISTWSFSGALGYNQLAQAAYYTNSPLWLLLFLVPDSFLISAIDLIVALRIGLSGLTFFIWLKKRHQANDCTALPFSTAYALSGFVLAFMNQFMWFDAVILLPLVALGIYRLWHDKSPWLYLMALAVTLFSNFYMAYMVCLFSVLYALYLACKEKDTWRRRLTFALTFGSASVVAAGLMAFVLLPTFMALQKTIASSIGFYGELTLYHSLGDMLLRLLPFTKISLEFGPPNLYSGLIVFLLVLLNFFRKDKTNRQKVWLAFFLLFSYFSFNVNLFDFVWHGFHYPNQLPGRQSFLFSFSLISIAYPTWLYVQAKIKRQELKRKWRAIVLLTLSVEIIATAFFNLGLYTWRNDLVAYNELANDMRAITETYRSPSDHFQRMEFSHPSHNLGLRYGFNGIGYYASTMSKNAYQFFGHIGMSEYASNVSRNYVASPLANTIFGVKYLLHTEEEEARIVQRNLRKIEEKEKVDVYENEYALPIAFVVDKDVLDYKIKEEDPDENLLRLWQAMRGEILQTENMATSGATFVETYHHFLDQGLQIDSFSETDIRGSLEAKEDGILFTSIENDGGWHVYIDNEEREPLLLADYCLGVHIEKGKHDVRFSYHAPGLKTGLILSGLSLLASGIWLAFYLKKASKQRLIDNG